MKKSHFYWIAIILFVAATGFIVLKYKKDEKTNVTAFYPLKERTGAMAQSEETRRVQKQFADLVRSVRTNPDDIKSRIALASLYIQEARISGHQEYYEIAAMKYVNEVLEMDSLHFEALTLKGLLKMAHHDFSDGLALAEKARTINPDNAFVHGILVDGHVELGNYTAAVKEADNMMSIRPDLRSYSRVSYLREIHGDYPGAIEAMKLAVDAGPAGDEATEWARVHLGKLYEAIGDLKNAEMRYNISLQYRPGYAYALAGLGRIATLAKEYDKAITYYRQAESLVNDNSFKEDMADVYQQAGQKNKSDSIINRLLITMDEDSKKDESGEETGHYADGELAHVYLQAGSYDNALKHALAEYNRRPNNIEVNETLAWVYYNKHEYANALAHIETATKTDSKDPVLLCRAGLIYAKTGNKLKAKSLLGEGTKVNCYVPGPLKQQSLNALQTL